MMRRPAIASLPVMLLIAALGLAPTAGGAVLTTLTIKMKIIGGKDAFTGSVKSSDPVCLAKRTVTVYGVKAGYGTKKFRTRSGATGKWKVTLPYKIPPGSWHAEVASKQAGEVLCGSAKSKALHF